MVILSKQFWINLPVKDISRSVEFFTKLGFALEQSGNEQAQLMIGSGNVMLFPEATFKNFTKHEITDTKQSTQVLFSIDAESREEVNELAAKAVQAGGTLFGEPAEHQGWVYGCGIADLDGHRWNIVYMDMSKVPPQ
jgi:uncharacterized protein